MLRFQQRVVECRQKHFADELVHQLAAAAMRHQDVRVLRDGNGTRRGKIGRGLHNLLKEAVLEIHMIAAKINIEH
jgi:hypothetical protein